jgi:hypothetical protein
MSKYTVEGTEGELVGTTTSVERARRMCEEYFQNGVTPSAKEIRADLKIIGTSRVPTNMDDSYACWIKEA